MRCYYLFLLDSIVFIVPQKKPHNYSLSKNEGKLNKIRREIQKEHRVKNPTLPINNNQIIMRCCVGCALKRFLCVCVCVGVYVCRQEIPHGRTAVVGLSTSPLLPSHSGPFSPPCCLQIPSKTASPQMSLHPRS